MYIPGFSNMLTQRMARGGTPRSRLADADGFMYDPEMGFMSEDMGGPAYVDFTQYAEPFPAEPFPAYAAPQDDFLERIRQAEAMAQAEAPIYTPDMGALGMIFQPENMSGPAYADMMPGAMPEQVSMLPFAPEAPAPQPMTPPSGLGGRQNFMDERDIFIGNAPDRFSQSMNMENYVAPQRDPVTGLLLNAQGQQGFQFMTDRGRQAGFGSGNTGFLTADPNAQYRMFDERGKNRIVAEGTGVEALQNIYNTANQLNKEQGRKANWGIERLNPTTGQWERVAENDPRSKVGEIIQTALLPMTTELGRDIIGGALPLAALAIPGLNVLGTVALGAGLGGAGAGIAGNNVLKGAVMGGLSAAGGKVLGPVLGKGLNIGSQAAGAIGTGLGATTGGLATGQSLENALIGGALAGAGSFAAGKIANQLGVSKGGGSGGDTGGDTGGGGGGGGFDASNIVVRPGTFPTTVSFTPPSISGSGSRILDKQVAAEPVITNDGMVLTGQKLGALGQMTSGAPGLGNIFGPSAFTPSLPSEVQGDPIEVLRNKDLDTAANMYARLGMETPQEVLDAFRQETPVENEIVVTDTKKPFDMSAPLPPLSAVPTTAGGLPFGTPSADPNEIVVTDTKKPVAPAPSIPLSPPVNFPTGTGTPSADPNEIVVTDTKKPVAPAPSIPLSPPVNFPTGTGMPSADPNEIVVTDTKKPAVPSISVTAPLSYTPTITGTPSADLNEIVVTDTKKPIPPVPSIPLTPPVIGTQPVDTGEIVVTDTKKPFDMTAPLPPLSAVPTTAGGEFGDKQVVEEEKKGILDQLKDRLGNLDAADYLRLAGVLLPLLDGGGGGRRGALSTIPGGMFGRSSVFGGSLPRATMPGASTGFAPRTPSALGPQTTQDYYRYGYGPAQSFFDYVPQGAPNTSRAFTGYAVGGMAGGGDMTDMPNNSFAVNGPGSGRSDEIPAMLSDGEYVMDAETVALLGDGSPKAGANRLDQFRINVRKDKGRNLVKGEFSANAKRPEHYLKGGRT